MNVVLYGATGRAGSRILKELTARGHKVTAVARDTAKLPAGVNSKQGDLSDVDKIAVVIAGADVVVSAYGPPQDDTDQLIGVTEREIAAVKKAGKIRLIVVGGAGSLEVAPGVSLLASGHLPAAWVPIATSHDKALKLLEASEINWTYFSPAGFFEPGERTGKFRLGTSNLVADEKGESRISMEDYAIALVDELEKPAHERGRFSIGY
ncbi:MAG: NAD(P)-dependent oxidoreductase [Terracidiphilus sp.]|nr:NAD(P)-dependent oxidoreductase [Terracidiphilus sp.]